MSMMAEEGQHMTLYFEEIPADGSSPTPEFDDDDGGVTYDEDCKVNPSQWSTEDGDPVLIPVELDDAAHYADKENIASQTSTAASASSLLQPTKQQQQSPPPPQEPVEQQQSSSPPVPPKLIASATWEQVVGVAQQQQQQHHHQQQEAPGARGGHSLVTIDDERILLFGGSTRAAHFFNQVHIYNPRTHRWTQPKVRGKLPPARCGHTAVYYDGCVYVYGGQQVVKHVDKDGNDDYEMVFFGDMWQLDCRRASTVRWTKLVVAEANGDGDEPTAAPCPRNGHTATLIGSNMFIIGGSNEYGPQADVYCFALDTLSWHRVNAKSIGGGGDGPPPACREGHCAWPVCTSNDKDVPTAIVVAGGRGVEGLYADCFVLLLTPNSMYKGLWCYVGQGPAVCNATSFCIDDDMLGVYGGIGENSMIIDEAYVFMPWSRDYWCSVLKPNHTLMDETTDWRKVDLTKPQPTATNDGDDSNSIGNVNETVTPCGRFAHAMTPIHNSKLEFVMMGGMSTEADLMDIHRVSFRTHVVVVADN